MKLSIVVYLKNEKREALEKCLDSITRAGLKEYEIVLIDDGSETSCKGIKEKYSLKYVKTPKRGKLASYLYGITLAEGERITFIDASSRYTILALAPALELDSDIVMINTAIKTENGLVCTENSDLSLANEELFKLYEGASIYDEHIHSLQNKVIKMDVIKQAKLEMESTRLICYQNDQFAEIAMSLFIYKEAKSLKTIYTGYAIIDKILGDITSPRNLVEKEIPTLLMGYVGMGSMLAELGLVLHLKAIRHNLENAKKLPLNLEAIEGALYQLAQTEGTVEVKYDEENGYTLGVIEFLRSTGKGIINARNAKIAVPVADFGKKQSRIGAFFKRLFSKK